MKIVKQQFILPWIIKISSLLLFSFLWGQSFPSIHPKNPIVVIPGILGSQLVDPIMQKTVWGKFFDLDAVDPHAAFIRTSEDRDGLELPINKWPINQNIDRLVPREILTRFETFNKMASVRTYENLIQLFSQCGLAEGDINHCTIQDNLFLFSYDWRRDLVEAAKLLGERIDEIKSVNNGKSQQVTIIAHSMGGIIAMYYMMYGQVDVLSGYEYNQIPEPTYIGAKIIDKIFFLGVPFEGNPSAFKTLHEGEYISPFVSISQWSTFTMPSIYELLPLDPKGIFIDENEEPISIDIFNIDEWVDYGFGIFSKDVWRHFEQECELFFPSEGKALSHKRWKEFKVFISGALKRGKKFQLALIAMDWTKVQTERNVISGDCSTTLSSIELTGNSPGNTLVKGVKSRWGKETYYHTKGGDGLILYDSQKNQIEEADHSLKGCFKHRTLPDYKEVQQAIINWL